MKRNEHDQMEDFIKNAVDSFNESPSDKVWENVSDRLDTPPPFYLRWKFWLASLGVLALILLALQNILLHKKITTLEGMVATQNSQIESCNEKTTSLIAKNATTPTIESEEIRSNFTPKSNKTISSVTSANPESSPIVIYKYLPVKSFAGQQSTISNTPPLTEIFSNKKTNTASHQPIENAFDKSSLSDINPILAQKKTNKPSYTFSNSKSIPTHFAGYSVMPLDFLDPRPPRARFGITKGTSTLFSDVKVQPNSNIHLGILGEYNLSPMLSLSGEILFNFQSYSINSENFESEKMKAYPSVEDLRILNSIQVRSNNIQIPIGLRWQKNIGVNSKIFVNSAVSWSFYLPQKFEYTLTDNSVDTYLDKRYFLYFGSYRFQAGIEKNINPKLALRMGLYGERGMIPLGVEARKKSILGIKASFFFGNIYPRATK